LLATFPPHIHFSRLGINNIAEPLFAVLAFGFLARGFRDNRPLDYALAGAMLGLTQYFYEGGRLLYPILALTWILALYLLNPKNYPDWRGVVTFICVAVLVGLPFYHVLAARRVPFTVRMDAAGFATDPFRDLVIEPSLGNLNAVFARLRLPFLTYVTIPDPSLFYTGQTPLLLVYLIPPFFVGLALLLRRLRGLAGASLLLLWLFGAALGNALLKVGVFSPRLVVVFPAMMLVAALGIVYGLQLLADDESLRRRALQIAAALTIVLAGAQLIYYFGAHLPQYNMQFRRADGARDGQDAVLRSIDFPMGASIHLIGTPTYSFPFARGVLSFHRPDMGLDSVENQDVTAGYLLNLTPGVDHAFYIEPGNLEVYRFLNEQLTLTPMGASPYDLPPGEGYLLYYAAAEDNNHFIQDFAE
jgi:hypothetical protein